MSVKLWSDPVWSKVIAAAIVGVAGLVLSYFAGWWPSIASVGAAAVGWIGRSTSIPNWLLILLSVCAIAVIVVGGSLAWAAIFQSEARLSSKSYIEDDFFDIRWRWRYDGSFIYNIVPFCPNCDLQLDPVNVSAYHVVDHIAIRCDECQITWGDFECLWSELENRVERKIHQKLRAGTWPEAVQRMLERRITTAN